MLNHENKPGEFPPQLQFPFQNEIQVSEASQSILHSPLTLWQRFSNELDHFSRHQEQQKQLHKRILFRNIQEEMQIQYHENRGSRV